jgi:hypothetical protein
MTIKIYDPTSQDIKSENSVKLFLAGGIDNTPNWQNKLIQLLKIRYTKSDCILVVFNPRRETEFSREDYEAHSQQVKWEFDNLRNADIISFWFPKGAPCTTSLFELGYWLNSDKVVLGIEPGHYKERSLKTQAALLDKDISISNTLDKLVNNIDKKIHEIDSLWE